MPHFCCVINCATRSNRDSVHFYRIPKVLTFKHKVELNELSALRQEKWLNAIKRKDLTPNMVYNARVCSLHFISGEPADLTDKLSLDWVPSLNMGYNGMTSSSKNVETLKKINLGTKKSEIANPTHFCRLCLGLHSIYFSLYERQIKEMLESLTSMKVRNVAKNSTFVCPECFSNLKDAYHFQQRLIITEKALNANTSNGREQLIERVGGLGPVYKLSSEIKIEENELIPMNELNNTENSVTELSKLEDITDDLVVPKVELVESHNPISSYDCHPNNTLTRYCKFCNNDKPYQKYQNHKTTHTPGKCEFCGVELKTNRSLLNHINRMHSSPNIICEICGTMSHNEKVHNLHIRKMHTGDATHICDTCGVKLFSLSTLNTHRMTHTTEKPFVCEVCNKAYAVERRLNGHKLMHSNKMSFVCEYCGKGFRLKCNFKLHQRNVHNVSEEKKYQCLICGKCFPSAPSLSSHHGRIHFKR